MSGDILKELKELRPKYIIYLSLLGDLFHHKNAEELARLSLNPEFKDFVPDYISFCLPEFRKEYDKIKRSQLEQQTQSAQIPPHTEKKGGPFNPDNMKRYAQTQPKSTDDPLNALYEGDNVKPSPVAKQLGFC